MKEIVIISGKGGTGKTTLTASFAYLGGKDIIVADCDVDAADMHLLMKPDFAFDEDFYSGEIAYINQNDCTQCGICADVCRFDAISIFDGKYIVNPLNCEGCGYCARVCPTKAIINKKPVAGTWYVSSTKTGSTMVHARLAIGASNSGKLVAKVKNESRRIAVKNNKNMVLIDGAPGIGCPVISSLSGASFVVLITEPSVSGMHDLKRVYALVRKINIRAGCIINKFDINQEICHEIMKFLAKEEIVHIANLPYDDNFTKAMTRGFTIVEYDKSDLKQVIYESWNKIQELIIKQ